MATSTKWGAVKDQLTRGLATVTDSKVEANLENADPELCIRLLQVGKKQNLRSPARGRRRRLTALTDGHSAPPGSHSGELLGSAAAAGGE